jgi:hypothetical protein
MDYMRDIVFYPDAKLGLMAGTIEIVVAKWLCRNFTGK